MDKKAVYLLIFIIGVILIIFFSFSFNKNSIDSSNQANNQIQIKSNAEWFDIELQNVLSGDKFTISQFYGRPILLESFAVWCPTCTKQQREIKKLHEEIGDDVVSIALDTDPNEDKEIVKNHAIDNGFNWYYVVSPIELTSKLIEEFGNSIVNAPSAPMILICPDGEYHKLVNGVKKVNELKEEISKC